MWHHTEPGKALSRCHCLTELARLISIKEEREYEENVRGHYPNPEKNFSTKMLYVLKDSRNHVLPGPSFLLCSNLAYNTSFSQPLTIDKTPMKTGQLGQSFSPDNARLLGLTSA